MLTINEYHTLNISSPISNNWIDVRNVSDEQSWLEQYTNICQQHEINKKWILMINPEDQSLEQLSKIHHIDTSKILKVNTNKAKMNLQNLASALCKGNCSAVILCNPSLQSDELAQLNQCAAVGNTAFIVLTNHQQLH